jgi:AcrR family transcriptional regulator
VIRAIGWSFVQSIGDRVSADKEFDAVDSRRRRSLLGPWRVQTPGEGATTTRPHAGGDGKSQRERTMTANQKLDAASASRRPRPTRISGDQTREKILNAAETLFAEQPFDSVSLRDITLKAGVTLALASYHFGTKEALFEAVVARRADILGRMRHERLAGLVNPGVRELLDAFMSPLFEKAGSGEPGWGDYLRVLARLGEHHRWVELLSRHFDGTARAFLGALQLAAPGADRGELARAFTFVLESMLNAVSQHGRLDRLTDGAASARDLDKAYRTLLSFVSAGMESVGGGA